VRILLGYPQDGRSGGPEASVTLARLPGGS